ncbi:MAG TPA: S9 family peptidase [Kofleriaceae bacterium]
MKTALVTLALSLAGSTLATAQTSPSPGPILDDLVQTRYIREVALSPDASKVAWAEAIYEKGRDTGRTAVMWMPADGKAKATRLGEGDQIAWAHDSRRIAWIGKELDIATVAGGPRVVAKLDGTIASPAWAPDDSRVAVLFAEHNAGGGPLHAEPVETGVIGGAVHNQRITLVDAKTGAAKSITPSDVHAYELDWTPDGKAFAFTAAPGPGDNNWWTAKLYTASVDGSTPQLVYKPALQIAQPTWSPDGKTIGFIEGLMSDEGFTGGDLTTIAATGGKPTNHTPGRRTTPNAFAWLSPTQLLTVDYTAAGSTLGTLDLVTGKTSSAWTAGEYVHTGFRPSFSASRDGKTVAIMRSDYEHAPEIWVGPPNALVQVTHLNDARKPMWGETKMVTWKSDGRTVAGTLLYPRNFDAAKKYPMIVWPHGGPAGIALPAWPEPSLEPAVMAGLGYFVFEPNPRGSYGQGEAFVRANVKDFGGGDLRDVMAGVDAVLKQAPVDPNRLGIHGWSYGGYMTMWTITQTTRFKAAVAGAGISNWQSYYGENSIDQWMIPYFGATVYDNPAVYAKSSPITFVKKVKTPTLIVVGERDGECPAPQSYELWHALHVLGVPTELVVFAGEGHLFVDPKNKRELIERAAAWFDKYLR